MSAPDNDQRAEWARKALDVFAEDVFCGRRFTDEVIQPGGEDPDRDAHCMIQDLICNLLHLAKRHGWDATVLVENAVACFEEEVRDEERVSDDTGEEAELLG